MSELGAWVVVGPKGLCYVGLHCGEESAWDTFLGWPSEDEIAHAKSNGYYAARANITWHKPKEGVT